MAEQKPIKAKPGLYALYFYNLKEIAFRFGYNLVLHGSMDRDLDLIAVPWNETISPVEDMLNAFCEYLGHAHVLPETEERRQLFADKFHGRRVYVINLNRGGKSTNYEDPQYYIDISVTPVIKKE